MVQEELLKAHAAPAHTPVRQLAVKDAFASLTTAEALYAHNFAKAAWQGAKVCLTQVSQESPGIFDFLLRLFQCSCPGPVQETLHAAVDTLRLACRDSVGEDDWRLFLAYAATFFGNMGNYLGFGDSKVVPGCSAAVVDAIVVACPARTTSEKAELQRLLGAVRHKMFSLEPDERQLGFAPDGTSAYYSSGLTRPEAQAISDWMTSEGIEHWNTRVMRLAEPAADGRPIYEVAVAAAHPVRCEPPRLVVPPGATAPPPASAAPSSPAAGAAAGAAAAAAATAVAAGFHVILHYGDHADEMRQVVKYLKRAARHAANATQAEMLKHYVAHFETGNIAEHRASQVCWVRDCGPVVETNIGFIESYRDPLGVRAEWEGLVAVVNKAQSAKFGALVDAAPRLLAELPWPAAFEKDAFLRPDFTSLEVLAFAGTGVPSGINIPNYDDIRQTTGFKNVSLGNVLAAPEGAEPLPFLPAALQPLFRRLKPAAFEVQVGCHELLGHGSGKMFQQSADGALNFDRGATINPLTGAPVASWYSPGQTYDSVFGSMSSALEECRAECTGIFMSTLPEVLSIFGHTGSESSDITFINWLLMARAGLVGLEFFSPATGSWRQAHMQARYAILRTLLAAAAEDPDVSTPPLVAIREIRGAAGDGDGAPSAGGSASPRLPLVDLEVTVNADKIVRVGVPAVCDLLAKIQICKATADVERAAELFNRLTSLDDTWLEYRGVVLRKKQPRPLFVQAHTVLERQQPPNGASGGEGKAATTTTVRLVEFPGSHEGVVQSMLARYSPTADGESSDDDDD